MRVLPFACIIKFASLNATYNRGANLFAGQSVGQEVTFET